MHWTSFKRLLYFSLRDMGRASMWRMPILQTLLQSVHASLVTVAQWRWGSKTPKPTTLLAVRLPLLRASMDKWQLEHATKLEPSQMGVQNGVFRAGEMKMYSESLSAAFAQGVYDGLVRAARYGPHPFLEQCHRSLGGTTCPTFKIDELCRTRFWLLLRKFVLRVKRP